MVGHGESEAKGLVFTTLQVSQVLSISFRTQPEPCSSLGGRQVQFLRNNGVAACVYPLF